MVFRIQRFWATHALKDLFDCAVSLLKVGQGPAFGDPNNTKSPFWHKNGFYRANFGKTGFNLAVIGQKNMKVRMGDSWTFEGSSYFYGGWFNVGVQRLRSANASRALIKGVGAPCFGDKVLMFPQNVSRVQPETVSNRIDTAWQKYKRFVQNPAR